MCEPASPSHPAATAPAPGARCRRLTAVVLAASLITAVLAGGCSWVRRRPPSVLLIIVDTLRADHLGLYGYARPTSPALDRWARKGVVFERAYAPSPWTLPSFGSAYTGQMPSKHRAGATISGDPADDTGRVIGEKRQFAALDANVPTLAEMLGENGFETAAIANNIYLHPAFGVARGFQNYDYTPGSESDFRPASTIVDRALAWLESQKGEPFFLVVHIMDPHMNYGARPPFRGRFTSAYESAFSLPVTDTKGIRDRAASLPPEDRMFITAAYDEEVAFVDAEIGRLLDEAEKSGLLRSTVVLLTADHGEELFDHGGFTHGHTMHEELLHVPFIVWAPGVQPGRLSTPVSLIDVTPTVLEAVGVRPGTELAGISLWPAINRQAAIPSRVLGAEYTCIGPERKAIIEWPYKLVFTDDGSPPQMVNLETGLADGGDAGADTDVRRRLLAQLKETFPPEAPEPQEQAVHLDQETRERLHALGYTD